MKRKEYITHDPADNEAWICICGNKPEHDGFFPCEDDGNEVSPDKGGLWVNLYVRKMRQDH